ncbi:YciI family protein [Flavobacterium sp.]|uniref:YciI family protein n=1 Tax=Flavobacterium sp. TaxID=239 RepID=UPI003D6BC2CC
MNEFLILIHDDLATAVLSEAIEASTQLFRDWIGSITVQDKFVNLPKIWDLESHIVRQNQEKPNELLTERRKSIGGLFLIKAKDYKEAVAIAKGCPALRYGAVIEIRMAIE